MSDIYVTAAFKCTRRNEAYIFMKGEYLKEDYAPGIGDDKILYGTARNNAFPSLKKTIFADTIDCAFASHVPDHAYIFAYNNCAVWAYPSDNSTYDKIIQGPMPIATMFPFLKGTVFENGIDAAFESSVEYEVYLFKGNEYAVIYLGPENPHLRWVNNIHDNWLMFHGTIFEYGDFDAALGSHIENEVYILKGDSYVRVRFTPHQSGGEIVGGVRKLKDSWPALSSVLPRRGY